MRLPVSYRISQKRRLQSIKQQKVFQSTVSETTKKAVDDAVAGADAAIEEKVSTQVTQSAREWKVEIMGADAEGNPNKILAAINASKEGIKIEGDRVEITGTLLAQIIEATGLNINGNFIVDKDGKIKAVDGEFIGKVETSKDGKRVIISPDTSSLLMVDSLGNKALEIKFPTWASGSTSAFGSYITIKSHRTAMQVGESLPWDSTIVISDEEISMEGTYNEYGVSGTVKRKVSINPYGISFYKNGSLKKTYNNE